jgi:quercetin dioxygenase-like cupin family protein
LHWAPTHLVSCWFNIVMNFSLPIGKESNVKLLVAATISLAILASASMAQESRAITVTPTEAGSFKPLPAEYFTGRARMGGLFQAAAPGRAGGATVEFAPGARTNWHTHPAGQTLIVTAGKGLVQAEGAPVREMKVGDVVWIPAGVRHWHGATADEGMTHIAIAEMVDGSAVQWMEPVTAAQYQR